MIQAIKLYIPQFTAPNATTPVLNYNIQLNITKSSPAQLEQLRACNNEIVCIAHSTFYILQVYKSTHWSKSRPPHLPIPRLRDSIHPTRARETQVDVAIQANKIGSNYRAATKGWLVLHVPSQLNKNLLIPSLSSLSISVFHFPHQRPQKNGPKSFTNLSQIFHKSSSSKTP